MGDPGDLRSGEQTFPQVSPEAGGGWDGVNTDMSEGDGISQMGLNPALAVINLIFNLSLSGSCVYFL